jgi:heme exporter protein C
LRWNKAMHRFANPARFARFAAVATPWSAALTALLFAAGLMLALFASPPDYQQGETVRIMYIHVPSAWMAMFAYVVVAAGSASALVWRHPLGDVIARAASPVGAAFTLLALVTGSLWGKPMWGAWWVWDARLTSVLVLFFLYLGHIAFIKFSVDWWNTLHQPASISRLARPAIDPAILTPLLVMAAAYLAYFVTLLLVRVRAELAAAKLRAARSALLARG